ncbi:NAD-dependent epimerase/dehydratase family protein [Dyadobacter pollutisoli]|jgi:nucleoside-diphosphate-sugar epimerase|uniref:NAD-dependent epimerase/dehydratase family protein n=1 Tax=Dyadobacter pollutisoli TaxID=2910158 RepID=A0A9E8SLL9_9BACT|nr:NAD-dependent epimerase/dehydratase family protein [Dyadobacter pollutisoli]WAC11926.1 NAD-dependent epimerase/dehydratase family protein [Dyadobacter pollutisoli]
MNKTKVVVLGASGFVGQSFVRSFSLDPSIDLSITSRNLSTGALFFDILQPETWSALLEIKPDIVIDASGYGIVKNQTDLHMLYRVNYLDKRDLIDYLFKYLPELFWVQIGTAFEYSLENEALDEDSPCFPRTHYGISKLLFSNYLQMVVKRQFTILRPFGMFGAGEDISKLFPLLIEAQKSRKEIELSDGLQKRDYFYVNDLADFVLDLVRHKTIFKLEKEIINVGTGEARSIRELSQIISEKIEGFDHALWNWGAIPQRQGENQIFYNASVKAKRLGFISTNLDEAFQNTVNYYHNL